LAAAHPRLRWIGSYLAGAIFVLFVLAANGAQARSAPDGFADLVERLSPAVVNISTSQTVEAPEGLPEMPFPPGSPFEEFFKDFFERQRPKDGDPHPQRPRRATSLGSGFIIDAEGLVITNNHVIDEADEVTVILQDGTRLPAELVGKDPKIDVAVLRVKPEKPLPAAKWGSSEAARVGDWVVAIGNPFGLGGTVTAGIISAKGRNINAGPYDSFIQTDAAINRGNSGGPLFNLDGEVIGINTAIISPNGGSAGIGFALPSSMARGVIDQLVKYGRTRRGWLGVQIQTVTDEIAESLGLDTARGALVSGVTEDSPASKAGIESGDVILRFDGKEVAEMRALPRIVAETEVGASVEVEVWRKGASRTVTVVLGELEAAEESGKLTRKAPEEVPEKAVAALGMTLSAITPQLRQQFELTDDAEGVLITEVEDDGAAAEKGLRPGDLIVEVSQEEVSSPAEVAEKVAKVKEAGRKSVLLLVRRGADLRFVALRLDD
jgi:serine protease Do